MKSYHILSILVVFFTVTEAFATNPWPTGVSFEVLPLTMSATHVRGIGFGFSLDKLEPETETLTCLQGDLSFPFMQKRDGSNAIIGGTGDFNGSFTMLAQTKPTFYLGGKVGVSMITPGGPIGFFAVSARIIPKNYNEAGFFSWITRQIDLGVFANKELYGAVRFGFKLL